MINKKEKKVHVKRFWSNVLESTTKIKLISRPIGVKENITTTNENSGFVRETQLAKSPMTFI